MGELIPIVPPRCQAKTKPTWYRPNGRQCPYKAVYELDGDQLCKMHADKWAEGEAQAAHEAQQEPQP